MTENTASKLDILSIILLRIVMSFYVSSNRGYVLVRSMVRIDITQQLLSRWIHYNQSRVCSEAPSVTNVCCARQRALLNYFHLLLLLPMKCALRKDLTAQKSTYQCIKYMHTNRKNSFTMLMAYLFVAVFRFALWCCFLYATPPPPRSQWLERKKKSAMPV